MPPASPKPAPATSTYAMIPRKAFVPALRCSTSIKEKAILFRLSRRWHKRTFCSALVLSAIKDRGLGSGGRWGLCPHRPYRLLALLAAGLGLRGARRLRCRGGFRFWPGFRGCSVGAFLVFRFGFGRFGGLGFVPPLHEHGHEGEVAHAPVGEAAWLFVYPFVNSMTFSAVSER